MPVSGAIKNSDGSVSATVDGRSVTLSTADLTALVAAPVAVKRPLTIVTGQGRHYGDTGPARYGMFYKGGAWHFLNKDGGIIPNTSWAVRNMNRSKFTFNTP